MKFFITLGLLSIILVLFSGCVSVMPIKEVKNDTLVGKQVTVEGIVTGTIKIGDISGYTLKDSNDSIAIYSLEIPKEGDTKTITGTLRKIPFIGYYIEETKE